MTFACCATSRSFRIRREPGPEPEKTRQVGNLFGQPCPFGRRNEDGIGKQVVNGLESGAGRLAPGRDLNWRRLHRKYTKAVALHMADKVDQNVDLVLANQLRQLIIREVAGPSPLVGAAAKMHGKTIFRGRIRIADDLELVGIVVNDDAAESVGGRLMPKMTAHISKAEPALRTRIVRMSGAGGKRTMGRPRGAFRLLAFGACVGVEI